MHHLFSIYKEMTFSVGGRQCRGTGKGEIRITSGIFFYNTPKLLVITFTLA